uniref:Cytochrome c oxidase subunit 7A1, mitochondrial n=3 Tax=Pipistrellus kuhlii TaxID=59472 RepID=A0A7J7UZV8_PIPKU|nr:cytochrome c oxidase subunit 7A1 [Pipistrellus kuhlii]
MDAPTIRRAGVGLQCFPRGPVGRIRIWPQALSGSTPLQRRGRGLGSIKRGGTVSLPEKGGDSSRRGGRRMRAMRASQVLIRSFSSTARNRLENRVAEKQKLFQADNDLPVHLKGGGTDNILYRLTMGLCLGGTVYSLYCLGWASFPHQK